MYNIICFAKIFSIYFNSHSVFLFLFHKSISLTKMKIDNNRDISYRVYSIYQIGFFFCSILFYSLMMCRHVHIDSIHHFFKVFLEISHRIFCDSFRDLGHHQILCIFASIARLSFFQKSPIH
jgi:hypothetical protein